jgi:hypothetical protein
VDHGDGEVGELDVLVAGVEPQRVERCLHGQSVPFREGAFRLCSMMTPLRRTTRTAASAGGRRRGRR